MNVDKIMRIIRVYVVIFVGYYSLQKIDSYFFNDPFSDKDIYIMSAVLTLFIFIFDKYKVAKKQINTKNL